MEIEREKLEKDIGSEVYFDCEYDKESFEPIDNFIELLQDIKSEGATHLRFSVQNSDERGYSGSVNIQPVMIYTESPQQAETRVRGEIAEKAKHEAIMNTRSKAEYERLKKIYG